VTVVVALALAAFGDLPPFTRLGDGVPLSGWTAMVTCVERGVWRVPRRVPDTAVRSMRSGTRDGDLARERMSASSREVRETFRGPFGALGAA
jgi:ATP-dependent phosphoenolpyruvate carboxykinase